MKKEKKERTIAIIGYVIGMTATVILLNLIYGGNRDLNNIIELISYIMSIIGIIFCTIISSIQVVYDIIKLKKNKELTIGELYYDVRVSTTIRFSYYDLFNINI